MLQRAWWLGFVVLAACTPTVTEFPSDAGEAGPEAGRVYVVGPDAAPDQDLRVRADKDGHVLVDPGGQGRMCDVVALSVARAEAEEATKRLGPDAGATAIDEATRPAMQRLEERWGKCTQCQVAWPW